jgi:ribose 5-phosphate isomerase A
MKKGRRDSAAASAHYSSNGGIEQKNGPFGADRRARALYLLRKEEEEEEAGRSEGVGQETGIPLVSSFILPPSSFSSAGFHPAAHHGKEVEGMTIYERALDFINDGDNVGLGSGRAATEFIKLLGQRVQAGLRVRGVPSSRGSEKLAREVGIPLVSLADGLPLAVTVDGADEVAPNLDLLKGWGRALVREKILAVASTRLVILVGQVKEVPLLGTRGKLPVEVVPFAVPLCRQKLVELGLEPVLYEEEGQAFLTDNGNHILDCGLQPTADPATLENQLRAIPGVVGTGLFLGLAHTVLVGDQANQFQLVRERSRPPLQKG